MLENGKIGIKQFTILVIMFTIGGSVLVAPSQLVSQAKQDAWIASIVGVAIGLLLVLLYSHLGSRFPEMTLAEYCEEILGKWLGKIVSFLFFIYFFLHAAGLLRAIGDFMTTQILPETPIQAIHIIFFMIVVMGVRLGLETFARASEILLPWVLFLFFILVLSIAPQIELQKIQPILEEGIKPVMAGTFQVLGLPYLQLVMLLMIFPYVNRNQEAKKAFLLGTLMGGILLIVITSLSILVLGPDLTERQMYPSYTLAKKINVGNFLQRVEAMVAGIWFITIYFKLAIVFYVSTVSFAQTFKLKDYRFLIFPLGMIIIVLSITNYPNIVYFQSFIAKIWTPYSLTFGLFFPILLAGVAAFRKKQGTGTSNKCL
ncbi:endospore germination permease [Ammoniphilus sp. 3BR4]|uniref:GerAB/ArcD/ProY family transporter n=1 Tax=Ammoniphilus sp. 3BR4 TaxID=3158265 RepID=UPI00346627B9